MSVADHVTEQWRPVPYYRGWEVSNTGKVRKVGANKPLKLHGSGGGVYVKIPDNKGRIRQRNVPSLVQAVFKHPIVHIPEPSTNGHVPEPRPQPDVVAEPEQQEEVNVTATLEERPVFESLDGEEWLPVLHEEIVEDVYEVSNMGRVRRVDDGHLMTPFKPNTNKHGAWWISVRGTRVKGKSMRVDRLVLDAFGPVNPDPDLIPIHKDGSHDNNWIGNLEWGPRPSRAGQGAGRSRTAPAKRTPAKRVRKKAAPRKKAAGAAGVRIASYRSYETDRELVISHPAGFIELVSHDNLQLPLESIQDLFDIFKAILDGK